MRLSAQDRLAIRSAAAEVAGPDVQVYLFGSRTRDELRGGDIDLLVELPAPRSSQERLQVSVRTAARLQRLIGERKIDVLVADPLMPETPLLRAAREQAMARWARPICAARRARSCASWLKPCAPRPTCSA